MNLDTLKQLLNADTHETSWRGEKITLRKIGAKDGLQLTSKLLAMPQNELHQPIDPTDMATFYATALSKSIVEGGSLIYDTPEGIAALMEMPLVELIPLAEEALRFSGMAVDPEDSKKNLPMTNDSSSSSAATLESQVQNDY